MSDSKTFKCLSSHFKAPKHTDSFILHNEVVIYLRYRYGCEVHSILRFLLDFWQIRWPVVQFIYQVICFSSKASYSWIVYTLNNACLFFVLEAFISFGIYFKQSSVFLLDFVGIQGCAQLGSARLGHSGSVWSRSVQEALVSVLDSYW